MCLVTFSALSLLVVPTHANLDSPRLAPAPRGTPNSTSPLQLCNSPTLVLHLETSSLNFNHHSYISLEQLPPTQNPVLTMATQKSVVSITFSKPGVYPPVYLAGSFSDPAWQPILMQFTVGQDNEHHFNAEVSVEEGRSYQYKFRVGEGDWRLNEDSPAGRFHSQLHCHVLATRQPISHSPL